MSRTTRRVAATLAVAALSGSTLAACGSSASEGLLAGIEGGQVTLGTKYDQPGLGLRNPDDSMSGLDVDIAQYVVEHIASANGWEAPEITWRETPSAQRETLIQNGEVDMITATYSINEARAETVDFAGPYLLTHQALLVNEDNTEIAAVDDLDGRILCSVTGSTPAQTVKEVLPGVQLQEYDTYSSCVEALRQGNIDALTTDATILNGYSAQSPGQFRVVEMQQEDGSTFTDEYYGIGLAKGDQEGTDAINAALEEMLSSGTFDEFVAANLGEGEGITEGTPGDLSFMGQ